MHTALAVALNVERSGGCVLVVQSTVIVVSLTSFSEQKLPFF